VRFQLAVVALVGLLASSSLVEVADSATPYLGVGASASALKRLGAIGSRAGYENDPFFSIEAPLLTTWPETTERDVFRPKRFLPHLPGTDYRVRWGLSSGIVLAMRLIGIASRPNAVLFKPLIPADASLIRRTGKGARCTGWLFRSRSLDAAIRALVGRHKLPALPRSVYVHAWWTAPSASDNGSGSAYVEVRTTASALSC
jgi:hypothetical protein